MRTELISIPTDTLPLDGAFHLPDGEPSGAVMLFHGNTMNFYIGAPRFLPPVLTRLGRELMLVPGWWYVISAESFLDRMTEMPDVLELAPTIHCPTLFIRGDEESPETYPAERFKERAGGPCDVEIAPNCNHFYVGREAAICEIA